MLTSLRRIPSAAACGALVAIALSGPSRVTAGAPATGSALLVRSDLEADMADGRRASRVDLSSDRVGSMAHEAIARLVVTHPPRPTARAVDRVVRSMLRDDLAPVYRQSLRARVGTAVSRYFDRFDRRPEWRPLGAELNVDDVRLDLVWLGPRGRIEADEVKAGPAAIGMHAQATLAQARQQLLAGQRVFGARFAGVRVVILAHPDLTFTVRTARGEAHER